MLSRETRVYPNDRVKEIVAAIPRGHRHLRLAIVFDDQVIVLHEATVAAIVRAYTSVALHPSRKGIWLSGRYMGSSERKHGFAKYQIIEDHSHSEDDAVETIMEYLGMRNGDKV